MGFFGTIKDEAQRNFIARADEAKGEIVYKYPEKNIRMLTQLTVDADEVALFVKDGKVEGKLGPGRHQLDTSNIPFLSRFVEGFTGGNLFIADAGRFIEAVNDHENIGALFRNAGTSTSSNRLVPDQEIRFDIVPRNFNLGR